MQKLLDRAAAAFHGGDFPGSERHCRAMLASDPDNAQALHLLALVCRKLGKLEEAERCFRASLEQAPENCEARSNFANLLRSSGRFREAIGQLRYALDADPEFRPARLTLARTFLDDGAAAEAEALAVQLTGRDCNDAEAWTILAVARQRRGKPAQAEAGFRSAIRLRPDYAVARHNLGALLCQLHRPEEALHELAQAERLGAETPELHYNRGSALFELGRFDEAEAVLLRAVEARPRVGNAHVLLAKLRYMRGDHEYARELQSVVSDTSDPALHLLLGDLLRRGDRLPEAESTVRALEHRHRGVPQIESSLAVVLQARGKLSEASAYARSAWEKKPDNAELVENLVAILLQLGDAEEAWPLIALQRRRLPLDQRWLAYTATAARLCGKPEHRRLYDYDRFVRCYDLQPPAGFASIGSFNQELARYLAKWHALKTHPLDQSLRHGTQTTRDLLSDPEPVIRSFIEALVQPLDAYRREIGFDSGHEFLTRNRGETRLVGCWSVKLRRGGYHVNHIHPEGWISSVYYVHVPDEVADERKRSGWIKFGEPRMPAPGVDAEHFVQPKPGRLVLFPSCMWHGTTPIQDDQARLTIAFDAIPVPA